MAVSPPVVLLPVSMGLAGGALDGALVIHCAAA